MNKNDNLHEDFNTVANFIITEQLRRSIGTGLALGRSDVKSADAALSALVRMGRALKESDDVLTALETVGEALQE